MTPISPVEAHNGVTPLRRPGSVRRTTTHACTRTEGVEGPVTIVAEGRDLLTGRDGAAEVLDLARLDARADAYVLESLSAEPAEPALAELAGANVMGGFRARVRDLLPSEGTSGSVRHQMLDDLPIALMLSGRALRVAGIGLDMGSNLPIDVCAGWVADGTLVEGVTDKGPPLTPGPEAPTLRREDDPLAWHGLESLPPWSSRRHRRLDVWRDGDVAAVDAFFRDSFVDPDGRETVVHQYRVYGTVDPETSRFIACEADAGPLPYPECPNALASANRLAGSDVGGLRLEVRKTFVGPSTCTHLNDTLRSLEDVASLLQMLSDRVGSDAKDLRR